MPLAVERFDLAGPLLLRPSAARDMRGSFTESFNRAALAAHGVDFAVVQDNESLSLAAGTMRGLHLQLPPSPQAKIVRVLAGAILDVAVDVRPSSPGFGRHVAVELDAAAALAFYVPAGFAHGFVTLEPMTRVAYKVDAPYAPACELGIAWDDPALGIAWPIDQRAAVLSPRDAALPTLDEVRERLADAFPALEELTACA